MRQQTSRVAKRRGAVTGGFGRWDLGVDVVSNEWSIMIYPCWWNLKQNKQQLFNAWDFGRGASADQIITVETEADSCPKSYSAIRSCFLLSEAPTPSTIESIGWWRSSIHILHYFCQGQESASVWQVCRIRYTLGRCWEYERQVSSRISNWALWSWHQQKFLGHDVIPSTVHDTQRSCVSPDHAKSCRDLWNTKNYSINTIQVLEMGKSTKRKT